MVNVIPSFTIVADSTIIAKIALSSIMKMIKFSDCVNALKHR